MAEYIEREALCARCGAKEIDACSDECEVWNAPAADVVEVVHGEWVCECEPHYTCSNCKHWFHLFGQTNYCPNCGAKMDGGNEDA